MLVIGLLTALVATGPATTAPTPSIAPTTAPVSPVIQFLEDRVAQDPLDIRALNRLAGEYLVRFRETSGDDADLERALRAANQSLEGIPADLNGGALAVRVRAYQALHRFAEARDDAKRLVKLVPDKRYPLESLGDALIELGDVAEAADVYAKVEAFPEAEPDPTTEVRLARLALARGDRDAAGTRFAKAVERARQTEAPPVVLAWALVRRGGFAFSSGKWEQAEADYLEALEVKPKDWPALDHLAELRAAQKRFDESIEIYRTLAERFPRPELYQALGDVYREAKRAPEAVEWHARAKHAYLDATKRGAVHYYHHLAGYYCDVEPNGVEAVRWAREDMKLRHGAAAQDALAWALFHANDFAAAAAAMDAALATGLADAHVLYHAALIYARAGRAPDGRDALRRAGQVNPRFTSFHVHR